jgi:hypothetical protein
LLGEIAMAVEVATDIELIVFFAVSLGILLAYYGDE